MSTKKSEEQHLRDDKLFWAIEKNDVVVIKTILTEVTNVNIVDSSFMSPLQHAAYKGNKEIVQLLLDQGADVNYCEHEHNYSALHFAGLSGNTDVCLALLLAGAKSHITNTVGRTAAQMAAFVGYHNCVPLINNFVPKAEIECFTVTNNPLLPAFLIDNFHKFIMQVNIHPVKIVLNVYNYGGLSEHLAEVKKVLETMCEKEMKKGAETNEVLSFKFHYLSYIVGEVHKIRQRQANSKKDDNDEEKKLDVSELLIRKLLKPGKDGHLDFMDNFLKECIREFPYRESTLFRQMVASLSGSETPSALSVVGAAINGQRSFSFDNVSVCNTCAEEKPAKKCSKCKVVQYCDRNCQRLHWHWHKKACKGLIEIENQTKPTAAEISADLQNLLVSN